MRCKYEGLAEFRGWSFKGKLDEMTSYFCGGLGTVSFLSQSRNGRVGARGDTCS
jgi:hypothetical protein